MRKAFRILSGSLLAVVASLAAAAAAAASPPNYQGLWWNSPPASESGWGLNVAHQSDTIFATWFTYDSTGRGWWLVLIANKSADGNFRGDLIETRGPAFSSTPFDPAKVSRTVVGSGTLSFRDLHNGTFSYTLKGVQQTKYITRQAFNPLPTCTYETGPNLAAATNYQDMWWVANGAESGWGINLTHQGDIIFATWFTYDTDGTPLWLAANAAKTGQNVFSGDLVRTTGPAFSAAPFNPERVTRTVVGTASFTFANGNSATFAYTLGGVSQTKSITRYQFFPPAGTRCGEPYDNLAPFTIVAVGDIADCDGASPGSTEAAATARLVGPDDGLVLTLGDAAYESGTPEEYATCFQPTWGEFKSRIRPIPGNHDYYTQGAAGYYDYFGAQAGPDRRGYYSFDYGDWHFIALNSMIDVSVGSPQHRWLLSDLEQSRNSLCTIAMLHYPTFNSGTSHGSVIEMRPLFDALQSAGVEMILSGHEHVYERFAPQKADGTADPARGLRQFVVGTGGAPLSGFVRALPNSEYRASGKFGILRLTLGHGSYSWEFLSIGGGAPIDAGTGSCHP